MMCYVSCRNNLVNFILFRFIFELTAALGSSFQRVLIAQIFRPDLMLHQLRKVSSDLLGISPDASTQPSVEQLLQQSSCDRPILMVSHAENDPTTELRKWANQKYREMAIGKGVEKRVLSEMRQAAIDGHWLCVKNVHLVPEFLTQMERELSEIQKSKDFRLWLLCESTEGFSEAAIYKCLKVRYEQPKGLKQIVMRLLQNFAAEQDQKLKKPTKEPQDETGLFCPNSCASTKATVYTTRLVKIL